MNAYHGYHGYGARGYTPRRIAEDILGNPLEANSRSEAAILARALIDAEDELERLRNELEQTQRYWP